LNTKAISPVIATVIIVSVAIAIAVAVAFWMTGITGLFTRYEKLEIVSAYATKTNVGFNITLNVRNTGTSDATVDLIFINGIPITEPSVGVENVTANGDVFYNETATGVNTVTIPTGRSVNFTISLNATAGNYISGQIVEVKLHTAAGNEYPKSVQLP